MMNIFKKIKKIQFSVLAYSFFSIIAVVLMWMLLFNPIQHFIFSTEEEYMEDVIGMYESEADSTLKEKGFKTKVTYLEYQEGAKPFTVFNMFPKPFTKVKKNRVVELSVFKDKSNIEIPNYIGLDLKEIKKRLKKDKVKLKDKNIEFYYDESGPDNKVTGQSPAPGKIVIEGADLFLDICMGASPNQFIVPDNIIGYSLDDVKIKLRKKGFAIGRIDTIENNKYLEETVFGIFAEIDNVEVEILEGNIYTIPMRINIIITKEGD